MEQLIIYSVLITIPFIAFYIYKHLGKNDDIKTLDFSVKLNEYSVRIQVDPKDTMAYYERGIAYLKSNNKKAALEDLKMASVLGYTKAADVILNNNLSSLESVNKSHSENSLSLTIDVNKSVEYNGALQNYDKVIAADPKNSIAYFMRSDIKAVYNDHVGAIEDLTNAIKYNKKYAQAFFKRGNIKIKLNDLDGAKIDLEMAKVLGFKKASSVLEKLHLETIK